MEQKKVLILCTGNSCRSQMAEALINHHLNDHYQAFSAGTEPSGYVHPKAIQVLAELGLDISNNVSKSTDLFRSTWFDYVITVCDSANQTCPPWLNAAGKRIHLGFADPAAATGTDEEVLAQFRLIRDQIFSRVLSYLRTELG